MVAAAHGRQRGRRRPRWPPPVARLVGLCALSVGSAGDAVAATGSLGAAASASSRALSSGDDLAALAAVTGALLDAAVGAGDAPSLAAMATAAAAALAGAGACGAACAALGASPAASARRRRAAATARPGRRGRARGLANATSGVDLLGAVGDLRVGVLACAATDGATVARSTMAGLLDATRAVAAASAASPGGFELAIADAAADAAKFGDRAPARRSRCRTRRRPVARGRAGRAPTRRPRARGDRLPVQEQRRLLEASRRDAVLEGWAGAWLRAVWEGHTHVSFVTTRRPDEPRTTRAAGLLVDWLAAYAVAGLCYRLLVFPGGPACGDSDGDRAGCLRLDRPAGGRRCFYEASSRRCYDRAPTADDAYLPPALVAVALVAVAALVPLAEAWDWFYERYLTVAVPGLAAVARPAVHARAAARPRRARGARRARRGGGGGARAAAPAAAAGRDQPSWREKRGGGGERGGAKRGGGVGLSLHNPVAAPAPASALEAACVVRHDVARAAAASPAARALAVGRVWPCALAVLARHQEVQDALRDLERGAWLGGLDYAARHRLREGLRRTRAKLCADWACHAPDALVRRCYWRLLVAHGEAEAWGRVLERCGSAREAELQLLEFCHLERLDARRLALYRKVHGDTARPYGQRRARAPRTLDAVVLAWVAVAAACGAAAALLLRAVVARAAHGHRAVRSWFRIAMLGRVVTLCFLDPLSLLVFRVLLPGALACAEFNHLLRSEKSRRAPRRRAAACGLPRGLATAFDQLAPAAHRRAVNAAFRDDSLRLAAFAAVLLGSLGALALGFFALERWRRRGDDPELAADGEHDQTYEQYLAAVIIARQAREATLQTAERRFLRFKKKGAPAPAPAPAAEPAPLSPRRRRAAAGARPSPLRIRSFDRAWAPPPSEAEICEILDLSPHPDESYAAHRSVDRGARALDFALPPDDGGPAATGAIFDPGA
ncbi:hypothetical protein JL720_1087 [Aureococcus anophagefferens]|nr:hypothetical protein JL720_1087 [Aureococcus anophagefferens]